MIGSSRDLSGDASGCPDTMVRIVFQSSPADFMSSQLIKRKTRGE
jgi:hypothetical protein